MRPVLMGAIQKPPVAFTPVPGSYYPGGSTRISASEPVVWNWSSTGSLPSCNVPNGGKASSISFSLSAAKYPKAAVVTLTSGANTWTIHLNTPGQL